MALYNKYGKSDDETIARIAAELGKNVKDTREIITAGLRNMSYAEFYRQYADEDGESSAEDVTRDDTTDPAKMFFDEWRADAVFDRYEKLDIRERSMIADHLGFCRECHGVLENGTNENGEKILLFRQKKAYADLALQHTLSSPDTAYRIVHKAYDKILVELAIDEYIHIVELRRKKKTKTEIVYEYCADHNNDWGEIHYTPGDDDYDVTRYVYAVRSINSMLASINSLFSFLGWYELRVKSLKVQQQVFCPEEKEMTKAEYERLCRTAERKQNERLCLILQTICGTGIRVSELQFITVEAVRKGEATVSLKGKTRSIFIVRDLQKKLLRYISEQHIMTGAIFITRTGKPMSRTNIWREMKSLCIEAEVNPEKVFPHNLRHLFARVFYGIEKDIAKLADILGHSSINTTRIYIISTGTEHRQRMERMRLIL